MAVIFDAGTSSPISGSGPYDVSFTVGAGSNRAIVALIQPADNDVTGVTWDFGGTAQALTFVGQVSIGTNIGLSVYARVAPTNGAHTLRVTCDGSGFGFVGIASFSGVDQTGSTTTFRNFNSATGTSTTPSVTVTTAAGDAVVAVCATFNGPNVTAVNNNQIFLENTSFSRGGSNYVITAGTSEAMSATLGSSSAWSSAGLDILAAASGDVLMSQIWM